MTDWADEIALKLRRNDGLVSVADALRKAKSDGMKEAAEFMSDEHKKWKTMKSNDSLRKQGMFTCRAYKNVFLAAAKRIENIN